jgi:NADH dehydrogenase FAD-containing subunit
MTFNVNRSHYVYTTLAVLGAGLMGVGIACHLPATVTGPPV